MHKDGHKWRNKRLSKEPKQHSCRNNNKGGTPKPITRLIIKLKEILSLFTQTSSDAKPWNLVPLTPQYVESEHGQYVKAIERALRNQRIHNIALSGNYGVGKSSILQILAKRRSKQVVELSLSTLAPIEGVRIDENLPAQATTTTNRIQQEIVKQLLYREDPRDTPGSRFRRIERPNLLREFVIGVLGGVFATVVFLITGWANQIEIEISPINDFGLWIHAVVFGVTVVVTIALRLILHGHFRVTQLSAGSATVTLDDNAVSYFDQYLDEIVYFFEVSKRNVVIFEDLDRFNNAHIFETLRSLNTLLNASPQINKKPVFFIYAIKDSIFDEDSINDTYLKNKSSVPIDKFMLDEVLRANRTKFFDLIIPVVPFITHRSARSHAMEIFQDVDHNIKLVLFDLAGRHVSDMRLLKNVRNEFIVFCDLLFSGAGEELNLDHTGLFAMMLYKSTHLLDFEKIRIGNSKLDELYSISRELVTVNIRSLEKELHKARQRLEELDDLSERSAILGNRLLELTAHTAVAVGHDKVSKDFTCDGTVYTEEELRNSDFWAEFTEKPGDPILERRSHRNQLLKFHRSTLKVELGDQLSTETWSELDRKVISTSVDQKIKAIKLLRGADMSDLIDYPEFEVTHEKAPRPFRDIAGLVLQSDLAYQLVKSNYINRSFALYTSTFQSKRVSATARNFIIHSYEKNLMDEYFYLKPADAEAVVLECGKDGLREPSLYNVSLLDHLLQTRKGEADIMIRSLGYFDRDQKRFMEAYLVGGSEKLRFVERMTVLSPKALVHLVGFLEHLESEKFDLLSVALTSLENHFEYETDDSISTILKTNYVEISALTSVSTNDAVAERIARLFQNAEIKVPSLKPLSKTVQKAFIALDIYDINAENLILVLEDDIGMALDRIKEKYSNTYNYVLSNLPAYLLAIDGLSPSVEACENFIWVVEDVLAKEPDSVGGVIDRASGSCVIRDINEISEKTWAILAQNNRFLSTFQNIDTYINSIGSLDKGLAKILTSSGSISEHRDSEDEAKERLARTILCARESMPSASLRVNLVDSLALKRRLDAELIPTEKGELFPLLLKHDLIEDNAETYTHLLQTDWTTRERYIQESRQFMEYMTAGFIVRDLENLILSKKIRQTIKLRVIERATEFVLDCNTKELTQFARFSTKNQRELPIDVVKVLASKAVPAKETVMLLKPHLETLAKEELFLILNSLGGNYEKLTSKGNATPKILKRDENFVLLEKLKSFDIVSSYSVEGDMLRVNKKRK